MPSTTGLVSTLASHDHPKDGQCPECSAITSPGGSNAAVYQISAPSTTDLVKRGNVLPAACPGRQSETVCVSDERSQPLEPVAPERQPVPAVDGFDSIEELDDKQPVPGERSAEDLNLPPAKLFEFITSDFESGWAAFAEMKPAPGRSGRGNMMFARQAMTLLEFASLLYGSDEDARAAFSEALFKIEPRYFTEMPGRCAKEGSRLPFDPRKGPDSAECTLLAALFDLMRHGLAHQYQTITVRLTDRRVLAVGISGTNYGDVLGRNVSRDTYLGYRKAEFNDLVLTLYPDLLYLDLKAAIERSHLLERGLALKYLARGGESEKTYQFDVASVEAALNGAGHTHLA